MSCTRCLLHKTCMSPGIFSYTGECDVLIVMDYPDSAMDFANQVLVGPQKKALSGMLKDAGLTSYKLGYTFAVKCKPPYGVKPLPKEIDKCRDYLKEEINARKPKAIVVMGDTALKAVTKLSGVRDKRGKALSLHPEFGNRADVSVYATYSTAFVQRTASARSTVVSDLRRVGDFLAKRDGETVRVPWKWWNGEEITGEVLAYDIEAVDENGKYTDYPTQIAITGDNGTFVSLDVRGLASLLVGRRTVGHNSWGYDVDVLRRFGIPVTKDWDTMVMAYFVDELQPLGLEALAVKYLGVPGWKEAFTSKLGSEEFAYYNARDTHYTMRLFELLGRELEQRNTLVEKLILPVRFAFDTMSELGVHIEKSRVILEKEKSEKAIFDAKKKITEIVGDEKFNPGSFVQVGKYLSEKCRIVLPLTESGAPKTSESVLQQIKGNSFVDALLSYREHKKTLSTYVLPYLKITNEGDGRAHPTFGLVRTKTGRTNAKNPNVQNLTRELKHFFCAPAGKVLASIDYSSFQFRIAAWFAQESVIIENYRKNPNWDAHTYVSSMVYDKLEEFVEKSERQVGKTANFSQLFLGTEVTLFEQAKKNNIQISLQECHEVHKRWHEAFPGFMGFYFKVRKELLATGQVVGVSGQIRHFGDPSMFDDRTFGEAMREAVNFLVQNLEAHMVFMAMKELHRLGYPMVLMIHDSLSFELPKDDKLDQTIRDIQDIMETYPIKYLKENYGVDFTIPLLTEAEIK